MNIGALFCNAENINGKDYVALPVIVWDLLILEAKVPYNYFSDLVVKILATGDKNIKEIHNLTNLDDNLIHYILEKDLGNVVKKTIEKYHLKEAVSTKSISTKKKRISVLQSLESGKLIPHPVHSNALKTIDYTLTDTNHPLIKSGTKGRPNDIKPFVIYPNKNLPEITDKDIFNMWDEYEYNDSEIALSDNDDLKSEYIDKPNKIIGISKRECEPNTCDYLLIKINKFEKNDQQNNELQQLSCDLFNCSDLLEPTSDIPISFLTNELKSCLETNEKLSGFLGFETYEIPISFKDEIHAIYPNFTENVLNEVCRFLKLKDFLKELENNPQRDIDEFWNLDDAILGRMQSMFECLLREKDVLPLPYKIKKLIDQDNGKKYRSFEIINSLNRKHLQLDQQTIDMLTAKAVWANMEDERASLKSLILRHVLTFLKENSSESNTSNMWFVSQLVHHQMFNESIKFLVEMANIRNTYQHFHSERQELPCSKEEIFTKIEQQLKIFNEAYNE